jgi:putative acetyltransferase
MKSDGIDNGICLFPRRAMSQEWIIRNETEQDFDSIDAVILAASEEPELPPLVRQLRIDGDALVGLVAELNSRIVGHMMSRLFLETTDRSIAAVALAPLMVDPGYQRRGIGIDLTRQALHACRQREERIVLVLGHPTYYPRFGFSAELAKDLEIPFPLTDPAAFMGLELVPGVLKNVRGKVRYPRAFGLSPE